jgi:hypothetical protein
VGSCSEAELGVACCDESPAVVAALDLVMRQLFAEWKREDEARFLATIGKPLTALLMAKGTSEGTPAST